MKDVYVLDTNAFFNYIKYASSEEKTDDDISENIRKLKENDCFISEISTIEIVSVLGKYSRGGNGAGKRMNKKILKKWQKLINEILNHQSTLLSVSILPFSLETIKEAKIIIQHSLIYNFGSLDSLIAATANICFSNSDATNKFLVTSDKGLKAACLDKCNIPCWDAFKSKS